MAFMRQEQCFFAIYKHGSLDLIFSRLVSTYVHAGWYAACVSCMCIQREIDNYSAFHKPIGDTKRMIQSF